MKIKLKKLNEQTIVITGASSGIGLVTARMAAKKGARLVLVARSEEPLKQLVAELATGGTKAIYVRADVAEEDDVEQVAAAAIAEFGGFDTWVNNAGVSIYGTLLEVEREDMRQLFETNFWGLINGSLTAARHLQQRGGGAIINVGSTLSDRAIPMQGMYCASKHAVKGFTDALRMELEVENAPVSVTLVKPGAIDTPYPHHAKNYMEMEPKNPAPVYAPEVVADVILHCAENPMRDVFAGAGGKVLSAQGYHAPRLTDKFMEQSSIGQQQSAQPRHGEENGLFDPSGKLQERGGHPGRVHERSLYSQATMHPIWSATIAIGAGLGLAALWRNGSSKSVRSKAKRLRDAVPS